MPLYDSSDIMYAMIFNKKQASIDEETVVLLLQVPRTNEKKELAAEQMLAAIHGLLTKKATSLFASVVHDKISFEIAVVEGRVSFFVWVPERLKQYIEDQIYAQYPNVGISEVEDYSMVPKQGSRYISSELKLIAPDPLPIKTFPSFEVDPLASITASLAQFEEDEDAWIQVIVRPAKSGWYKKSERYAQSIRGSGGSNGSNSYVGLMGALSAPPEQKKTEGGGAKLAEHETARASAAEAKSHKLAYATTIRVVYSGKTSPDHARMRLQSIVASFKQFNSTYLNGFEASKASFDIKGVTAYQNRSASKKPMTLNIEELASLYHLPHTNVETPNILWSNSTTAEPPANLPVKIGEQVSKMGNTNFRGHNTLFGLPREDRGRHLYIIGQTGTGKSGLLELLTISDIDMHQGFAVIDPHGDYAMNVLKRIPEARVKDVVYFNPSDAQFPIAFNPLEVSDPKLRTHACSELIGVLKRMFDSWGPRLEYILRYSILALLDYPDATMLDITRILTDKKFRAEVLEYVTDPVVKNFWTVEFASWNDKFAAEAVAPVLNKVGAFTANPLVRNIIGQPTGSFSIREIMDQQKILIVNLSRGLIGEDNASLLGALMVTKVQMAAMSRADIDSAERKPFYLYVDEFQNFATDSFATILSEARKYGLNLTVANQYTAQMEQSVKDAVFGNVGSIISFRTSADDARTMLKYFEPKFVEHDMVHMHNRHFVISMTIHGEKVQAFSATTTDLPAMNTDNSTAIIQHSREQYGMAVSEVEEYIHQRYDLVNANTSLDGRRKFRAPVQAEAIAPTQPVQDQTPSFNPEKLDSEVGRNPEIAREPSLKPKRKRTRSRKKKATTEKKETSLGIAAIQHVTKKLAGAEKKKPDSGSGTFDDETTISLR